jgi:hypothetical protein
MMLQYQLTTHKYNGIVTDQNDWVSEVRNALYLYDLLLSVIDVSVQMIEIVRSLPKVDISVEDSYRQPMYDRNKEQQRQIKWEFFTIHLRRAPLTKSRQVLIS